MPHTSMIAKIRKIDITNKVSVDRWSQTISITLSDIEMNDENLIAIRKFRPNEEVRVHFSTLQLTMEEMAEREDKRSAQEMEHQESKKSSHEEMDELTSVDEIEAEEEVLFQIDYEETPLNPQHIVKTFDFSNL